MKVGFGVSDGSFSLISHNCLSFSDNEKNKLSPPN